MAREPLTSRVIEAVDGPLREHAPEWVHRAAYRLGYLALRPWWRIARPHTRGVKIVVRCGDRVLLVRHAYARRRLWDLPGGFVRADEDPARTAVRELREELGITGETTPVSLGTAPSRIDGKREVLYAFRVDVAAPLVTPDRAEIADVRWAPHDALPSPTLPLTRRLVARSWWAVWDAPPAAG